MLPPVLIQARRSWRWVPVVLLAAGTIVATQRSHERAPRRVAVRVACDAGCEHVRAIALDVWSEQTGPGLPIDVVVRADQLADLGAPYEILVPDIDADARAEMARLRSPEARRPGDFFADFKDYRAITSHLHELAAEAPERVSVHGIGSTLDGRSIWALRIGGAAPDATPMLINGTQHAREWISAMSVTCIADRLVHRYDTDAAIRDFVDHTELWVVPVANPDGFQHSWASDRYWRKNRRDGHGVDLNRNFGVAWGGTGSSSRKRSDVYHGAHAFSEPETAALRDLAKREQVKLHIDYHAYSQLVLYPWGYTATPARDRDRLAAIGDRMASAIFAQHQNRYELMSAVELYPAAGTMTDWVYGDAGALSYTIELRPRARRGGFVLPPSEIKPTCDEALAGLLALRDGV